MREQARLTAADVVRGPELAVRWSNMVEPFLASAAADPTRTAIVFGDVQIDYAAARSTVYRLARTLRDRGVRRGDKVAYLLPNCPEIVELFYAVQLVGAVAVPLNVRSVPREIAYLVQAAQADTLIFAAQYTGQVDPARDHLTGVRLLCVDGACQPAGARPWPLADLGLAGLDPRVTGGVRPQWAASLTDLQAGAADEPLEPVRDPDALSRIQFTGGSTGVPKGVERTHRADLVNAEGTYLSNGLDADERKVVLIQCPLEHHGGHAWFTMAVAVGATLVLCAAFDPAAIARQIERQRVSFLILLPPTTLARLMHHPAISEHDLASVRLVQSAAGGLSPEVVAGVHRHFPQAVLNYGWGQTESGLGASLAFQPGGDDADTVRVGSVGRPMPFTEMRVVDDDGAPVPDGVVGEAQLRSSALMRGYHHQPDATAQAFTADGWLRTGDLMRRDADGYYYLMSRRRDLIKSGGENVFVSEVEDAVRTHPGVADCLVFAVPDDRLGEMVAVAVEPCAGAAVDLDAVQETCRGRLSRFKVPRHLYLLDSLGRDWSGKLDKPAIVRSCRVLAAVRASEAERPDLGGAPGTTGVAGAGVLAGPAYVQVCTDPEIFAVPLPHVSGVEEATWCYLLPGRGGRSLLVDTASDTVAGLGLLARVLADLGVDRADLDVLVTHEHADHTGLTWRIRQEPGRVLAGEAAVRHLHRVADTDDVTRAVDWWVRAGFTEQDGHTFEALRRRANPTRLLDEHPVPLADGTRLTVAGYEYRLLATPGHTPGSVCLYHPERRVLLTGDHLLAHVTPPLCPAPGETGVAAAHLASLARVADLPVDLWLPAHGPRGQDHAARARHLIDHHEERARRVAALVADRPGVRAADLVAHLDWHHLPDWQAAPLGLRWLTAGQTTAYLDLLVERGTLRRDADGRHHLS